MPSVEPARIMVADDDASIREFLREFLQDEGYRVIVAETGDQAVKKVAQRPPDLVLLDFMLPGMDGYEVLQRIRASGAAVPVIMITAQEGALYPQISRAMGAVYHLTKPFKTGDLLDVIARALGERA